MHGSRWISTIAAAVLAFPGTLRAADLNAEQTAKNVESFEVLWTTVRDAHFDPKLGGLDWQAVHDELKPKVEKAMTMAEARAAMSDALARLKQTHFAVIPGERAGGLEDLPHGGPGETGMTIRMVDGKPAVFAVEPRSPAERAGVKRGWIVDKVGDKDVAPVLAKIAAADSKSGMLAARQAATVAGMLGGPVGGTVVVEFRDGKDAAVKLDVGTVEPGGVIAQFGNLPPYRVRFTSRRVDEAVGYVSLNAFFDPATVMAEYARAIGSHRDASGMVIDLRGNPGGIGAMAIGMSGWLISERGKKLGTMILRDGSMSFQINPRPGAFAGPVAILVDESSASTSEIFAGGLKDLKRARIFGVKTAGAALPSQVSVLPNGDLFQYAIANFIAPGGKPLEGGGVTPDVEVPLTRKALLEGHDPALEAAVAWIRQQPRLDGTENRPASP